MAISPWSKTSIGSSGVSRGGTASALHRELSEQSSFNKNIPLLLVLFIGLSIIGARQYDLLDGTPLEFLAKAKPAPVAPKTEVVETNPAPPSNTTVPIAPSPDRAIGQNQPTIPPVELRPNQGLIILQSSIGSYQVTMDG